MNHNLVLAWRLCVNIPTARAKPLWYDCITWLTNKAGSWVFQESRTRIWCNLHNAARNPTADRIPFPVICSFLSQPLSQGIRKSKIE
ncbi:hypothetical protein F5Y17DRAFT_414046 [Xylariaceae sp. FL0594]|nr:hypothetical protein F5Y17DRAFT_414046 [Xylariaceae sp. FL0594]